MSKSLSSLRYAIVGATGVVGRAALDILESWDVEAGQLSLVASERSAGKQITFKGSTIAVEALPEFDFSQTDVALFSSGRDVSSQHVPRATSAGCVVIDNTSCFRYENDIPLVVPEINASAIAQYRNRNIIANPNCSTIGMLLAVKPIHDAVGVRSIQVATYQSVSGAGAEAIEELSTQSALVLEGQAVGTDMLTVHPKQIAFNVLPHIDKFQNNGFTREEMKMVWETQKILSPTIEVNPTCVRVPVFFSHSAAIHLETEEPIDRATAIALLQAAPNTEVIDEWRDGGYPTAATDATGKDPVYVGRIRESLTSQDGLNLWVVSDNLRKGAALNSLQIVEKLAEYLD